MKIKYLINKVVYFYPEEKLLRSIADNENPVSLNTPASRCLLLLLQKQGEIVTKFDFSQHVWESRGQYTSTNTLYQNISLIRKALREIGFNEDVIHTIPREGFKFLGTALEIEEDDDATDDNSHFNLEQEDTSSDFTVGYSSGVIQKTLTANDFEVKSDAFTNSFKDKKLSGNAAGISPSLIIKEGARILHRHKIKSILTALIIACSIYAFHHHYLSKYENDFFSDYQPIGKINRCTIFKNSNDKLRTKDDYLAIFNKSDIFCEKEKNAFIALNTQAMKIFIHVCDPDNNTSSCSSTYYLGQ